MGRKVEIMQRLVGLILALALICLQIGNPTLIPNRQAAAENVTLVCLCDACDTEPCSNMDHSACKLACIAHLNCSSGFTQVFNLPSSKIVFIDAHQLGLNGFNSSARLAGLHQPPDPFPPRV